MSTRSPGRVAARTPQAVLSMLVEAFNHGDIDALADIYEEDATLVFPPTGRPVRGRADIRAAVAPVLARGPRLTSVADRTLQTDTVALAHTRWELVDGDGRREGRGTVVSRRRPDGSWGIAVDDPLGVV
jgi:uncharacterized protein (TIGR02246 family)